MFTVFMEFALQQITSGLQQLSSHVTSGRGIEVKRKRKRYVQGEDGFNRHAKVESIGIRTYIAHAMMSHLSLPAQGYWSTVRTLKFPMTQ